MPAKINTTIRNGELIAATQEMIQGRLEEFAEQHRRLKELRVSVDVGNPAGPVVEIEAPIGEQALAGKASADNVVQAVDDAIRHLQRNLAERLQERKEQEPEDRDDSTAKIVGGAAAVLLAGTVGFTILRMTLWSGEPLPEGMPVLHPVTLEFTQAGTALTGAAVQLVPMDPANTWVSGGGTGKNGKVSPRTHGKYDGVPAGKYKVCVSKTETEGDAGAIDMSNPSEATVSTLKTFSLVDLQYTIAATTPLEIEVTGSSDRFEPFELGEPVRKDQTPPPI